MPTDALADVQPADYRREPTDSGADLDDTDRRSDLAVTLRMALDMLRQHLDRAEQAAAGEPGRANALRDQLDAARAEARQARETADTERQLAREAEDALATLQRGRGAAGKETPGPDHGRVAGE